MRADRTHDLCRQCYDSLRERLRASVLREREDKQDVQD